MEKTQEPNTTFSSHKFGVPPSFPFSGSATDGRRAETTKTWCGRSGCGRRTAWGRRARAARRDMDVMSCRSCLWAAPVFCGVLTLQRYLEPHAYVVQRRCTTEALRAQCLHPATACTAYALLRSHGSCSAAHHTTRPLCSSEVERWMPPADRQYQGIPVAGNINYGVQRPIQPQLDTPVDAVTTYSDLLAWLLLSFGPSTNRTGGIGTPRYLEIGVSVGKNLHQISAHAHSHFASSSRSSLGATLVGLDLEPFNPQLLPFHPRLGNVVESWPSPEHVAVEAQTPSVEGAPPASTRSLKTDSPTSTVARHRCASRENSSESGSGCSLFYVSADLKTAEPWKALATAIPSALRSDVGVSDLDGGYGSDHGFDLIFSDAWHSAAAVRWEARQLLQWRLLNQRTVIVWDDLNTPAMQEAFGSLCLTLRQAHPAVAPRQVHPAIQRRRRSRKAATGGHGSHGEEGSSGSAIGGGTSGGQSADGSDGGTIGDVDDDDDDDDDDDKPVHHIDCFLSAVAPGWVVSSSSNLIGIAGPSRLLEQSGLQWVLPSRLRLEDFGFRLPEAGESAGQPPP